MPTKDNLLRRGVIDNDSRLCIGGCGSSETSAYLFLHCQYFGSVWIYIHSWLGVSTIIHSCVADHFNQFRYVGGGGSKVRISIIQLIWYATMWNIWKERNNRLFTGKECSILQSVNKIKALTLMWLKAKLASLPFNYHGWWLCPFTMLGIG